MVAEAIAVQEYIRKLSPEQKEVAFQELVKLALHETGGKEPLPVVTPEKQSLGCYFPPGTYQPTLRERVMMLTEEQLKIPDAVLKNPDDTFDADEFFANRAAQGR
jgi:hypothetical protein